MCSESFITKLFTCCLGAGTSEEMLALDAKHLEENQHEHSLLAGSLGLAVA